MLVYISGSSMKQSGEIPYITMMSSDITIEDSSMSMVRRLGVLELDIEDDIKKGIWVQ